MTIHTRRACHTTIHTRLWIAKPKLNARGELQLVLLLQLADVLIDWFSRSHHHNNSCQTHTSPAARNQDWLCVGARISV